MPDLLERDSLAGLGTGVDERLARFELRRQIGRLERELAALVAEGFGRVEVGHRVAAVATEPRLLDLGETERLRDDLAERVADARQTLVQRDASEGRQRQVLEAMLAAPAEFKWVKITRDELGLPGCGAWHSRPRLGPIGMLMGWWRVKVSSGCPLAGRLAAVELKARANRDAGEAGTSRVVSGRASAGPLG
jgi:hypothetical protein